MAKKVISGVVAGLALLVVGVVRFAPGMAEKVGLGFLVKASAATRHDQQQNAWHSCTLDVPESGSSGGMISYVARCTVQQKAELRAVKVYISGKKQGVIAEQEIAEKVPIAPDTPWEHQGSIRTRTLSRGRGNTLRLTARFFYPDDKLAGVINDPRDPKYDQSRNTQIEEEDERKNPEKYKLLLSVSARW